MRLLNRSIVIVALFACAAAAGAADPIHDAARRADSTKLTSLLAAGADVNAVDAAGETPLHKAARLARVEPIATLLAAGADPNARNLDGQTPLHVLGVDARRDAIPDFEQYLEGAARLLIEAGADPEILDAQATPAWPREEEPPRGDRTPPGYPSYDQIAQTLLDWQASHPAIAQRFDLGASSTNKRIYAIKITDNIAVEEDEPEFRYISTMHGDEVTGVVMCLNLIEWLLTGYGSDPRATNLVDNVEIWIVPCMNPYGYINNTRVNAQGVDLNRNFPEWVNGDPNTTAGRAPETATIMNWCFGQSFTLSANFHGGALVMNYPFDNDGLGSVFSPSPDQDLFVMISEEYSEDNLPMWNSSSYYHGITNGAAWYSIDGGLQDWSYRYMGDNDVTIELGPKSPSYSQMPTYWSQNQESMISYMEQCLIGVRGVVTDRTTGAPLAATVAVLGRNHDVFTDPDVGDYQRMLLPGSYELRVQASGYDAQAVPVTVRPGDAVRADVAMAAPPAVTYPNGGETLPADSSVDITWTGHPTTQFQVQWAPNDGETQTVVQGFEDTTLPPEFTSGGSQPWTTTTSSVHSGSRSARAGAISHDQTSWMIRFVSGGTISFWYRVSSESGGDYFNFYIDGVRYIRYAGTRSWTSYSRTLSSGIHELRWEYTKDSSASSGSDTVWVDDLSVVEDVTAWSDVIALTPVGATSTSWIPTAVGDDYKVRVRAYHPDNGAYGAWDESDATFEVTASPFTPGDMDCSGSVNVDDVEPFVLALIDPDGYVTGFPTCNLWLADLNGDSAVDGLDIQAFVQLLTGS